jgi:outer membrane receptor for ferric coprogen and ferric-rhodotorulic acid
LHGQKTAKWHTLLVRSLVSVGVASLGSLAVTASVLADEASAYKLSIPDQPLEDALQELARQTGIQIVFVSQITNGLRAKPLVGEYTPTAALGALLAGSGLTYRVLNPLTIVIRREDQRTVEAGQSSAAPPSRDRTGGGPDSPSRRSNQIEEVVVRGTAEQLVATRTQTPLREIPQTLSIISHEQIEQQGDMSLADALSHAPGVSVVRTDSLDPDLYVRGFPVTSLHIDGGATLQPTVGPVVRIPGTPDLSEFDHIEVLRGADGLFGGNGNPGAAVSLVRKRPLATPALDLNVSAGSWNDYRVGVDATGPLALDGALRGRIGGVYLDRGYFYKTAYLKRRKIFGILEYQITAATTLTLGGSYQADDALPFTNGLPFNLDGSDPHLPRETSLTTDWSYYRTRTRQAYLQLRQRFGNDWTVKLNVLGDKGSADFLTMQFDNPIDPTTGMLFDAPTAFGTLGPNTLTRLSSDFTLTGTFDLFGRRTNMAFGGDYTRVNAMASSAYYNGFRRGIENIHGFDPSLYPEPRLTPAASVGTTISTTILKGLFASLKVHLSDAWSVIGGARISNNHINSHTFLTQYPQFGVYSSTGDPHVATPYGAVIYDLNKHYSLYMSYADIFQSNGLNLGPEGNPLGTRHGVDAEVGIKAGWREGSLNGTLVGYKINQYGYPVITFLPGVQPNGCCFLRGDNKSQGVDVELNGTPAPGWLLGAGYTYNTNRAAELVNRQPGDVALASTVPKHLLKVWTSNRLPGLLNRWTVGGNVHAQTSVWTSGHLCGLDKSGRCYYDGGPYRMTQGGYVVVDLRFSYQVDTHWRVALRVNNVFDKIYYESIGVPTGNNWYGEPRNFLVQINGNF